MTGYARGDIEVLLPGGRWQADGEYLVKSPLREERTASFRINLEKASWIDFGTGEGGKLSDLFRRLNAPDPWVDEYGHGQGAAKSPPGDQAEKVESVKDYWKKATPISGHEYLRVKNISIDGLRVDAKGNLLIPGFSMERGLASLERISPSGDKRHLGQKKDTFFVHGDFTGDSPIFLAEGFATAVTIHQLTDSPVVACFGPNLDNIGAIFAKKFPGRELIACPDSDPAGEVCGHKCRAIGMRVVELPPGRPKGHDWNDEASHGDLKAAQDVFCGQLEVARAAREPELESEPAERSRRFKLQRVGDIPLTEPDFLVDGLFESDILALFFGESQHKKSFVAFDLAASIATGAPFHGRPVKEGAVVYIAGEGQGGIARRRAAWEMHRGISLSDAPLRTSTIPALFMDEQSFLEVEAEVAKVAEIDGAPLLIIIDTVARAMVGGDENSAKDTSIFIERVDALRRKYGAAALLVHHSGLSDKGRLRGSSAWRGALDAEFHIEASGGDLSLVTATCKKMKDAAIPAPFRFEAIEYIVLEGRKGPLTSLALEPTEKRPAREERLSRSQKAALDSFAVALRETPTLDADGSPVGLHLEDWREAYYSLSPADSPEAKKKAFQRVRSELVGAGVLKVKDDIYSLAKGELPEADYGKRVRELIDSGNGTAGQIQNVPFVPPEKEEEKKPLTAENMPGQAGHTGTLSHLSRSANYNHRDKRDIILKDVPCPGSLSRFGGIHESNNETGEKEEKHPLPGGDFREEIPAAGPTGEEGILPPGGETETKPPSPAPQENEEEKITQMAAEEWIEKFPRLKFELKGKAMVRGETPEEARELYEDLLQEAFRKFSGASPVEPTGEDLSSPWPGGGDFPREEPPEPWSVDRIAELTGASLEDIEAGLKALKDEGDITIDEDGKITPLPGRGSRNPEREEGLPDKEDPGRGALHDPPPEGAAVRDEPPESDQGRLFGDEGGGPVKTPTGQGEPTDRPRGKGPPGGQVRLDLEEGPAPGQSLSSYRLFGRLEPGDLPEDLRSGAR